MRQCTADMQTVDKQCAARNYNTMSH